MTYWGIKAAVDALKARYDELHKNADDRLPDSDFAYVWQADNGVKHRHWRMKNAREVKAAAEALHRIESDLNGEFAPVARIEDRMEDTAARISGAVLKIKNLAEGGAR